MTHHEIANQLEQFGYEVKIDSDDNNVSVVATPGNGDFWTRIVARIRGDADAYLEFMDFAEQFRFRRLASQLTQAQAAERCGVNPRTLQRWESGTTVPMLRKQAAYLRAMGDGK